MSSLILKADARIGTPEACRDEKARVVSLTEIISAIQRQTTVKTALRPVDHCNKGLDKKVEFAGEDLLVTVCDLYKVVVVATMEVTEIRTLIEGSQTVSHGDLLLITENGTGQEG